MSSKQSPSKKDDKSSSLPSAILTRHQSTFLNTRQLRNKDSSRKKISEITQLLMSPTRVKSTKPAQSSKKRSPKDKKNKVITMPKKQLTVRMTKLQLDENNEVNSIAKKRKIISIPKVPEVRPAKAARACSLLQLCEEQSLDDEDLLEILTCESPVWWEDPPDDSYDEDAIFTRSDDKHGDGCFRDISQPFTNTNKHRAPPVNSFLKTKEPDSSNITIPEMKQNDKRFMKKRNKLENLLGNIKSKLNDTFVEVKKTTQNKIDKNIISALSEAHEIDKTGDKQKKVDSTNLEQSSIKQYRGMKRMRIEKTPSESTSSSDDMFLGFQNDDVLNDLENMEIPVEDKTGEEKNDMVENSGSANRAKVSSSSSENVNTIDNNNVTDSSIERAKNCSVTRTVKSCIDTKNNSNSLNPKTIKSDDPRKSYYITSSKDEKFLEHISSIQKDKSYSVAYKYKNLKLFKINKKPTMLDSSEKVLFYDSKTESIKTIKKNNEERVNSRPIKKKYINFESCKNTDKSKQNTGPCEHTSSDTNYVKISPTAEVSVKDTGSGTNDVKISPTAEVSVKDTGSGTNDVKISPTAEVSIKDTGSGTNDVKISPTAEVSVKDTGSGTNDVKISPTAEVSVKDTGSGTNDVKISPTAEVSVKDTGSGTNDVKISPTAEVSIEDTGSGTNDVKISPTAEVSVKDAGSGTNDVKISPTAEVSIKDTGSGTNDVKISPTAEVSVKDTGSGTNDVKISPTAEVSVKDAGSGTNDVKISPTAEVSIKDTGSGTNDVKISPTAEVSVKDTGSGTNDVKISPTAEVSVKDAGSGTNDVKISPTAEVYVKDTGSGTNDVKISPTTEVSVKDTGSGTNDVKISPTAEVSVKDTGSGTNDVKISPTAAVSNTPIKHVTESGDTGPNSSTDSLLMKSNKYKDSVKIYFIDTTSKNNERMTIVDSKLGTYDNNNCTSSIENEKSPSNSLITNQELKEESVSLSDPIKQSKNDDENNSKNIESIETTDSSNKNNENSESSTSSNKNTIKEEKEVKSNKSKSINKDQLMAVYKIITDESYRENYMNSIKNEVDKINTSTNNIMKSSYGLESLLKQYNNKSYTNKRLKKEGIEMNAAQDKPSDTEHKNQSSNEVDTNDDKYININKIILKEDNSNKVDEITDAEEKETNCLNIDKTDAERNTTALIENSDKPDNENCTNKNNYNDKKDKICVNCDSTNTEKSLNIKSNIKSAKYCLKCSSIFETETCSYCTKKSQTSHESRKSCHQPSKGNA